MRILHVIPSLEGGGAERQLAMLATEQKRRGWDVHIALRRPGVYYLQLCEAGVRIHVLGDLPKAHPLLFLRLALLVRKVRPTLIQSWLAQMDIVGGIVALGTSVPWVMTERNSRAAYTSTKALEWTRTQLGRRANAIVANSNEGASYWRQVATTVECVPNAVDVGAIVGPVRTSIDHRP